MNTKRLKKLILAGLGIYAGVNGQNRFQNLQYQQTIAQNNAVFNLNAQKSIKEANNYVKNLLNIPDVIKTDDLQMKSYDEVFGNIGQITYDTQANIQEIFKKGMFYLLHADIKNQVGQILNYDNNRIAGSKQLVGLVANCDMVLKKYNKDSNNVTRTVFEESLDNTVNALNEDNYEFYVNALKVNDKKSFIIAPITSSSHLFSVVLYKKQENDEVYFEMVVVNKGGRVEELWLLNRLHGMYESYKIPKENISEIAGMLGYRKIRDEHGSNLSTGEVYKKLREYTINNTYEELRDMVAKNQVIGNCYYKELEAGFKFAYSNAYNEFEIKVILGKEYKTPKWPIDTMRFQKELVYNINNIIQELPRFSPNDKIKISEWINEKLSVYIKNKNFRKTLEQKQTYDGNEILKVFVDVFGDGKINDATKVLNKEILRGLLKDVDYITFNKYKMFFIDVLEQSGISIPKILENAVKREDVTRYVSEYMVKNKQNKEQFFKEYLPSVYDVVLERYGAILQHSKSKSKINDIASTVDVSYNSLEKM